MECPGEKEAKPVYPEGKIPWRLPGLFTDYGLLKFFPGRVIRPVFFPNTDFFGLTILSRH